MIRYEQNPIIFLINNGGCDLGGCQLVLSLPQSYARAVPMQPICQTCLSIRTGTGGMARFPIFAAGACTD